MATLFVVGTPIGNLSDITARALETLRSVDLIACEDTRHTKILLDRYKIETPTVSYHQHSSLQKLDWLLDQLKADKDVALVTDAGTPGISDPGGVLVEKIHRYNGAARSQAVAFLPIKVEPIPGASSLMAGLSISGMPADSFLFLGFLPKKKGRQSLLRSLFSLDKALQVESIAFFESAIRINKTLMDIKVAADAAKKAQTVEVFWGRELTKKFEELWRGSLEDAIEQTKTPLKGEVVVVIRLSTAGRPAAE